MSLAPIAVFCFKRPEKLKNLITSLSANWGAPASDLYIFIDGPRNEFEVELVDQVRRVAEEVSGFRSINVEVHPTNLGLAHSLRYGISKILSQHTSVIVLEDDLVLSPDFLRYVNSGLIRYERVSEVASIQGFQYPLPLPPGGSVALKGADCWGWATWKNRWESASFDASELALEIRSKGLEHDFDLDGEMPYLKMLENQRDGLIDSWAICWHASMFLQNRVSIYPEYSLVFNDGHDGQGTHRNRSRMFDVNVGSWSEDVGWPQASESSDYRNQMVQFYKKNNRIHLPVVKLLLRKLFRGLLSLR